MTLHDIRSLIRTVLEKNDHSYISSNYRSVYGYYRITIFRYRHHASEYEYNGKYFKLILRLEQAYGFISGCTESRLFIRWWNNSVSFFAPIVVIHDAQKDCYCAFRICRCSSMASFYSNSIPLLASPAMRGGTSIQIREANN